MMDTKRSIAYLDVLGFTNYLQNNESCNFAANILHGMNFIILQKVVEQKTHPFEICKEELRYLARREAITSFDDLLTLSDSIFITSKDDANLFIEQLSSFLAGCFHFTYQYYVHPENTEDPTMTKALKFDLSNGTYEKIESKEYPIIFRGGISFDEVINTETFSLIDGKFQKSTNLLGRGVVRAVNLEKTGKGPNLYIDDLFYEQLNDYNKALVECDSSGNKRFLWPAYAIISKNNYNVEIHDILQFLQAVINLWKAYRNEPYGVHYLEFLETSIHAFVKVYQLKDSDEGKTAYNDICNFIRRQGVDLLLRLCDSC